MGNTRWTWRRCRRILLGGVAAPVVLTLTSSLPAAEPTLQELPGTAPVVAPVPGPLVLDLAAARRLALEKQPRLAAYRASLASAQAKVQALDNLPALSGVLAPDLKVRKMQACLGVQIAEAQLNQGAWDTLEAVTRLYWGVVYAEVQTATVDAKLVQLRERLTNLKMRELPWMEQRVEALIEYVSGRRASAVEGRERALAALREAIGLEPGSCVAVVDKTLPIVAGPTCKEEIVRTALERRGELAMAHLAAEVTALEVDAQHRSRGMSARTFAAGADIHSRAVPQGSMEPEYRPGAIPPEMPTLLAGSRHDRVDQAQTLSARAWAVSEKARHLIALEAEAAFHRWREAATRAERTAAARDKARSAATIADEKIKDEVGELLRMQEMLAQFEVEANENVYRSLLELATLERVTAGGFCPSFVSVSHP